MRRRLRKFLPIVLIALMVQIFAPIAACWAASIAASDPLGTALICSGGGDSTLGHTGQTGDQRAHDGACSMCCVVHAGASADTPQTAVLAPYREPARVAWLERVADRFASRPGSHAQARAPPSFS